MQIADFDFHLPEELIAQTPLKDRSASRLLVLDRETGTVTHSRFSAVGGWLKRGDVLVINDTRVIPARLIGEKPETKGRVEFLLLRRLTATRWQTLVKPGRRLKVGSSVVFGDGLLEATVVEHCPEGERVVEFHFQGVFEEILDRLGEMPLPPYIHESLADRERYQTVYARERGSAAAPTAGLHFTPELMADLRQAGIEFVPLTLHVGLGTFRPVQVNNIHDHHMHSEYYQVTEDSARRLNEARQQGRRIIAVGTTSARTLETIADEQGLVEARSGWTDIFIYPGYRFKILDGLITNFHLPKSTLIMLVSALAGRDNVLTAYRVAVAERYRFFSFGDAMLII